MKKRLLSLLLACVLVLSLLPAASVFAVTAYELWIDGVQVTDANSNNILGGGEFGYNSHLKELYIYKDYESENVIIDSHIDGLTIYSAGDDARRLVSTKNDVIQLDASTTILGSRLYLETKGPSGIASAICYIGSTGVLTIRNSSVEAHGAWTINGYHEGSELHVDRSKVSVYATDKAVSAFGNIRLTDCEIVQPLGGYVKLENNHMSIVNVDGTVADHVEIGEFFELWLDGTQVTRTNAYDPLGDGTFAFDPDTKTLTVKKDYSSYSTTVYNKIDGLTVTSVGHHTLQSRANHVFINEEADMKFSYADLTIKAASVGIYHKSATDYFNNLRILSSKLEIDAQWGICGDKGRERLLFEESDVDIHASKAAVCDIGKEIELTGCHITPDDCAVAFGRNSIKQGADLAKDVHILPNVKKAYPLVIRGWQVTNLNAWNIGGDDIFSYDPKTNELTVKGDVSYAGCIIAAKLEGLKIVFKEDVKLQCTDPDACAIELYDDAVIEADKGTVSIQSASQANDAIYVGAGANLTVSFANDLRVSGDRAILGSGGKVFFENSNVTCASKNGAVVGFDDGVRVAACGVKEPAAYEIFNGEIRAKGGTEPAKKVVISTDAAPQAYELWIMDTQVNDSFCDDILGNGVFSYDPAGKVLTVAGDYEAAAGEWLVKSGIDGLTIRAVKDAELKASGSLASVLDLRANATITGAGELSCIAELGSGIAVSDGAALTIDDAKLCVAGGIGGIVGGTGSKLSVKNAYVAVKCPTIALSVAGGVTQTGVTLTRPEGGRIDASGVARNADDSIAEEVEFTPDKVETYSLAIDGVIVTAANCENVLHDGAKTFTYDPTNNILSVNGSYTAEGDLILSEIPDLRIEFSTDLALKSSTGKVICTSENLSISGQKAVALVAKKDACIEINTSEEKTLTVADLILTCQGVYGIRGNGEKEKLVIDNASVQTICIDCGVCSFGGGITLKNCYVKDPADAKIEGTSIVTAAGDDLGDLLIERGDKPPVSKDYTVTYDANGHGEAPPSETVENGKTATKPADPAAKGWSFGGWFTDKECTKKYDFAAPVTGNLTLYAKWTEGEPTEPTKPTEPTEPDKPCDGGENCPSKAFTDVNRGDWYHEAVDFAVTKGLFNGMSETTFEPNTPMSRAMLVTVLWRYEGKPTEGTNDFTDVPAGQWYTDAVAWAAKNGIVNGVGAGKFDPDGKITREQLAAILFRYSGSKGYDVSKRDDFASFPDKAKVSSWATDAYGWAVAEKLITGNDGRLDPQGNATRAQVATILMRFIKGIAK